MRYDALLVRHLAAELDAQFAGQPVHGIELSPDTQRVTIDVGDTRLQWNLHPGSGYLGRIPAVLPLERPLQLLRRARWQRARALFDERVLIIDMAGSARPNATAQIVIELLTNQWNAITLDADGRILRQLKSRTSTGRELRRGQPYQPPQQPVVRSTASLSEWRFTFERAERAEWPKLLQSRFVYASPLNAQPVFDDVTLDEAFARYQELIRERLPHLVPLREERLPYSHHLWSSAAEPQPTLLAASEQLGGFDVSEDAVAELARRLYATERKRERLRTELGAAEERAHAARSRADLLMAYASTIARGTRQITLPGFDGTSVTIELDAALSPIENAQELYKEARKLQRAGQRLPKLLQETERVRTRLLDLHERAQAGTLSAADVRDLARVRGPQQQSGPGEKLPYRRYRTSGGLEVRVGRSARANDELTLHHASPRDIWLHARQVGGAHVVLRWQDAESNPPLHDIMEAAILAALHSQARTSRTVPVDYTRRRYVTKRRKSPAGQVMLERSKTVFVEPDPALEEKLRWPEDELPFRI